MALPGRGCVAATLPAATAMCEEKRPSSPAHPLPKPGGMTPTNPVRAGDPWSQVLRAAPRAGSCHQVPRVNRCFAADEGPLDELMAMLDRDVTGSTHAC